MKTGASLKNRQGGAVAVMVGISMVLLVGFLAMVIDLGHLYVAKTGLQNAADAAALSGAKELKGDLDGINNAVARAKEVAAQNTFFENLGQIAVDVTDANIFFSNTPYPTTWLTLSQAQASPAGLFFIKVETGQRSLQTWFAPIWNMLNMSTFGVAVAGPLQSKIGPLAICALQVSDCPPSGTGNCGYIPGMAYNTRFLNPIGPGTPYWLDPAATQPSECSGSTAATVPFACTGDIPLNISIGSMVYTNSGLSNPLVEALNSRFDVYGNAAKCDPVTAPPDRNKREYRADDNQLFSASFPPDQTTCTSTTNGCNWQVPAPFGADAQQAAHDCTGDTGDVKCDYTNAVAGANTRPPIPFYPNPPLQGSATATGWPPPDIKTSATPPSGTYQEVYPASGTPSTAMDNARYYDEVTDNDWVEGRRNMNLVIVECAAAGGNCRPAIVRGVGSYFMTTKAGAKVGDDSQPTIYLEFNRMLSPGEINASQIRLFQ